MAINVPLNAQFQNADQAATYLQGVCQSAVNKVQFNLGGASGAKALRSFSQPLGRLTGQADEFTKSLDAANARVLAFGASVGIVNAVTNAFKSLVNSTIEVEKAITAISIVGDKFTGKTKELGQGLFKIAKETGQSFSEVSKAALEFSRQGLLLEDTLSRTQDALILTRLTGLDAAKSVDGLTAAFNAFSKAGLTTTQIVNKLAAVDQAFAVSSADLIEGFNRSAAVAQNAGVTFDELAGIITALQQETSRGGAVIGNALKTIFTRLQDTSTLNRLSDLGIAVKDLQNNLLPARQILQNLATDVEGLGQITKAGVFKDVAGAFQINQLISLVGDLNRENSVAAEATLKSAGATNEAYIANEKLNQSLDAVLNKVANTGKQLGSILGELGLTDNLKGLLDGINSFLEGASNLLQGDDIGSKFAKGFVKGVGAVLSGPGLGIFLAIIGKLSLDLAKFGAQSLKAFFGIGKAAADQKLVQESIVQTLIRNQGVAKDILTTQGGQNAQALKFLGLLNQQATAMQAIQVFAGGIASPVYAQRYRATPEGLQRKGKAAGGYLPAQEASDVSRGVGGASPSSKVVSIPNFAFGGGKRGTMIANTSEYIVPNYAGGGSAIFNQDMVKTMGLPAGAKKISAAGGFIPNFADEDVFNDYALIVNKPFGTKREKIKSGRLDEEGKPIFYNADIYGINPANFKKGNSEIYSKRFSAEKLEERYKTLAIKDAKNFSEKAIGQPISPVSIQNLANAGSVPSLAGTIFETAIQSVLNDDELIKRLSESQNAPFDFVRLPKINELFNVPTTVPYLEAKSTDSPDARKSFAKKIDDIKTGRRIIEDTSSYSPGLKQKIIAYKNRSEYKSDAAKGAFGEIASGMGLDRIRDRDKINKKINRIFGSYSSASGYIPNFAAAALQQAIAREKSAGLSDSQIYIDQDSSLKSSMNPMGLMVANRRDEPAGGFQGIARARKEGLNPKLYGAASGFVPNYAVDPGGNVSTSNLQKFNVELDRLIQEIQNGTKAFDVAEREITAFAKGLTTSKGNIIRLTQQNYLVTQGSQQLQSAYQARQQAASVPPESPKSIGDSLAKVIGIQSAAIGLQQVFESLADEGSDFAKNTKTIGGVISAVTSGFTLLTAGLGGIGIVLAGVTIGFNLLRDVFPDALQSIKESFGGLSLEGQKASKALDDFAEKVAKGGVSVEEALKNAEQQAAEAILRTKAKQKGVKTETETGEQKDPVKLARELVIESARRNQTNLGLGQNIYKKTGTEMGRSFGTSYAAPTMEVAYSKFGNAEAVFSDLNESTQNVIFDIFEEAVSVNKTGLVALGQKLQKESGFKAKDFKDLVDGAAVQEYRSQLLVGLIGGKDALPKIQDIIKKATTGEGKDQKIDQTKVVELLKESGLYDLVKDYIKEIIPAAAALEDASQANIFRANLDDLIRTYSDFSSSLNRSISNRISLLEGYTSSQTFAGLNEEQQFKTKSALERFKSDTSFQSQKRGLIEETQSTLKPALESLAAVDGIDVGKINELSNKLSTLDVGNLEGFLNEFGNTIKLTGPELREFKNNVSKLNNKSKDLFANRETEIQLLNFSIQERQTELASIKTFYQGLDGFNQKIRDQEKSIRNLDFQKTLSDQTAQYEREFAQLTSTSPEELRARTQAADTKATANQASIEKKQNEIRAKIELEKAINTIENIKALNRNTEALQKLLTQFSIENLREQAGFIKLKADAQERPLTQDEQAKISNINSQISALQNPVQSTGNIKDLSSITFPKSRTEIDAKITEFGVLNDEEKAKYKERFNRYFDQIDDGIDAEKARNDALKNQQGLDDKIFAIKKTYINEISNELTSLRDSQYSPKSRGEYQATERQINRLVQQEGMTPEGVRDYRSSFGYGLDKGIEELEKRTLDYKQELGVEIPRLFSSNLAQGLNDAISGAKDLKTALTDAATSFFQEISRKNISNLADMVTGGLGSLANTGFGALKSAFPGGVTTKASGGFIKGGSGTKDDVPAMLMGGEYVVKKSAVNKYGKGFLDALNNGKMRGYATGGLVDPETFPTQTGRSGFFTPGDYGQGAITGKNELLTFATQSFTGGQYDYMGGFGMSGASVGLEPESARLSSFGRENSPMFERVQQSKDEAFGVYLQGLQKEKEYSQLLDQIAKDKKARKKQLQMAIISAVASTALNFAGSAMLSGAKNSIAAGAKTAAANGKTFGFGAKFMAGAKGMFTGAGGQGGLANIFKGTGTQLSELVTANQNAKMTKSLQQPVLSENIQGVKNFSQTKSIRQEQIFDKNIEFLTKEDLATYGIADYGDDGEYRPHILNTQGPNPLVPPLLKNSPFQRAAGGLISGGSGTKDDVPAMLTGGEFVLNNRATQRLGVQNLNKLNNGQSVGSESSSAEMTQALISKLDELIQTTSNSSQSNVVVNVSTTDQQEENPADMNERDRELQKKIRQAVLDVIAQEKRLGGSLEKSR